MAHEAWKNVVHGELSRFTEWRDPFQTVVIDVDSCLSGIEGIDLLADLHGKKDEVEILTTAAMNGDISFDQVFGRRLDIIKPDRDDLAVVGERYIKAITPDARVVIEILKEQGIGVWLVSGGYDEAIYHLAHYVGVPKNQVFANHLYFEENGEYVGFDKDNTLSGKSGKLKLIEQLRGARKFWGKVAIIGDSTSETEARQVVDLCIGFGGHVSRRRVAEEADVFIDVPTFAPVLPMLLGRNGMEESIQFHRHTRRVIRKGLDCLNRVHFQHRAKTWKKQLEEWRAKTTDAAFDYVYPTTPLWQGK